MIQKNIYIDVKLGLARWKKFDIVLILTQQESVLHLQYVPEWIDNCKELLLIKKFFKYTKVTQTNQNEKKSKKSFASITSYVFCWLYQAFDKKTL